MSSNELEDLDWYAFRYVAGEMSSAEAAAFESRMADDQSARDAVCRAVSLSGKLVDAGLSEQGTRETEQISSGGNLSAPQRTSRTAALRAAGWMTIGAAATVVIAHLIPHDTPPPQGPAPSKVRDESSSPADALVWAKLQTASQWAGDQKDRSADELEWSQSPNGLDVQPVYPLPSWVHSHRLIKQEQP